ncbi:Tyrocidine synthase 3 [Dyella sp. AD56]|nr:Tyrocidine synthase 3 [Dyella sp. AD56]
MADENTSLDELKQKVLQRQLEKRMKKAGSLTAPIPVADRRHGMPLSYPQRRLWFLDRLDPAAGAAYLIPAALRLRGVLDAAALRAALDCIVDRHEVLRTAFVERDGVPYQEVAGSGIRMPLCEYDLRSLPPQQREERLQAAIAAECATPFDLTVAPLVRCRLWRISDDEHVVLLVQHHIVSDGWSLGVLIGELAALYSAFRGGQGNPLPSLPVQYGDYAAWQRREGEGSIASSRLDAWRERLSGAPDLLTLPCDYPRPSKRGFRGATVPLNFPSGTSSRLRAFALHWSVTPFNVLLAAWTVLLSRLSGQRDVVIGASAANRDRREVEGLIGFFVNTLALRIDTHEAVDVAALMKCTREVVSSAFAALDIPFEQVVDAVSPARNLGYSPLFQIMLNYDNTPSKAVELPGLRVEALPLPQEVTHFDLTLALNDDGEEVSGRLEYAADLFHAATAERWADHFTTVLDSLLAADAATPLSALDVLGPRESEKVVHAFNHRVVHYPEPQLLHRLFEAQASRTPDAIAVEFEGTTLSYAELDARANRLARYLRAWGCRPDVLVGIGMERSLEMVVAQLGVLKAGAAFLPLDPSYPVDRLAYMLEDANPPVLLTQERLAAMWPVHPERRTLLLDGDNQDMAGLSPAPLDSLDDGGEDLCPDHLAYVIYTSGSSGRPKGVMVHHRGIANHMCWLRQQYPMDVSDVLIQKTPFSFDASIWDFFSALICGARLLMAAPGRHFDVDYLTSLIISGGVTRLKLVPTLLRALLEHPRFAECTSLRAVFSGGEALSHELAQRFFSVLPGTTLYNHYGPTETSVNVTYGRCLPEDPSGRAPIGWPIANTRIYIVDEEMRPIPVGAPGEMLIGGVQVARGYLNRPDLTEERFVPDPIDASLGRVYRTGDLCRWLADGSIEYLGRNDFQVKIRGFRIELGEIEAQFLSAPEVRDVVVIAREDEPGVPRLVAYVVARESKQLELSSLRERLAAALPDYMVPAAIVPMTAIPTTPNGKTDRKALPLPDRDSLAVRTFTPPATPTEHRVAAVWREFLRLEQVGRDDGFFQLGGHSMLAISVVARLREQGDVLDVHALFSTPVLRAFCARLDAVSTHPTDLVNDGFVPEDATELRPEMVPLANLQQADLDAIVERVPGGIANLQDVYPLAPLQEGILFHHLAEQAGDPYLSTFVLGFPDRGAVDRFVEALRAVVARHDILRTSIQWDRLSRPMQVVQRRVELPLHEVAIPDGLNPVAWLSRITDSASARIALDRAPLIALHAAADPVTAEWRLALVNHHMISDHVTLELILREVEAFLDGRGESLPRPPSFRSHVAAIASLPTAAHEEYFAGLLGDVAESTVPFGVEALRGGAADVHEARHTLSAELATAIRGRARANGTTPAALFHVAWAQVVARCSGRDDVVFGTVLSGRMGGDETSGMMGVFINTLPFRMQMDARTVDKAVEAASVQLAELLQHEHAPLALAQRCSAVPAPRPLFTSLLNYRHAVAVTVAGSADGDWDHIRVLFMEERTHYPLSMSVNDEGEGFSLVVHCARAIHPLRPIELIEAAMTDLIERMEAGSREPLSTLEVLSTDARERLLSTADIAQGHAFSQASAPHRRFMDWAVRTPEAIALVVSDGRHGGSDEATTRLTYAELARRAEGLAKALVADGVQPGELVGLCAARGVALVVGMLGICLAGAAYLPLDPVYPGERLAFMLDDAAPSRTLADEAGAAALRLAEIAPTGLRLIDAYGPSFGAPTAELPPGPGASDPAYVIYTSGSTGLPKGVIVEHAQLASLFDAAAPSFGFGPDDVWTLFHSFAFDFSVWELWGALCHGGRLVIVPAEVARAPGEFHSLLCREGVTVLNQTPSAFRALAQVACQAEEEHRLRVVVFGGEALDYRVLAPWIRRTPLFRTRLVNMYGITEITVHATLREVTEMDIASGDSPIGRALPHQRLYVLDDKMRPVPAGVAGEIYVAGQGVVRGYLGREELTAQRFIADPFVSGARMYRTGDLGRWRDDGDLDYLGRNDQQVKIRGHRIEPAEVEGKLATHPAVEEIRVIAHDFGDGDRRLVAYVVPSQHTAPVLHRLVSLEGGDGRDAHTFELPGLGEIFHLNSSETRFLHEEIFGDAGYLRHGVRLDDDCCVFDVGANIGMFALYAGTQWERARIFAFEPIPQVSQILRLNAALHGLDAYIYDCGLSDQAGEAEFVFYPQNSVVSSSVLDVSDSRAVVEAYLAASAEVSHSSEGLSELLDERMHGERMHRPLRTVSQIIREHDVQRIDLLKVDVEGAEWQVLMGIEEAHWPRLQQVVVEVHDIDGRLQRVSALLEAHGFFVVAEQAEALRGAALHNLYATRTRQHEREPARLTAFDEQASWRGRSSLAQALQGHAEALPVYMRPSHYVTLASIPLTVNGKLDAAALPQPGHAGLRGRRYAAPVGPVERNLAELWCELLQVEQVSRDDDFFGLGGHSLSAVQLSLRMRERFDIALAIRDIFRHSSLYAMAEFAMAKELSGFDTEAVASAQAGLENLSEEELLAMLEEGTPLGAAGLE